MTMTSATSLDEGCEVFKKTRPDLTLVDIRRDSSLGPKFLKEIGPFVDSETGSDYTSHFLRHGRLCFVYGLSYLMVTNGLDEVWIEEAQRDYKVNVQQAPFETGDFSFSELVIVSVYQIVDALYSRLCHYTHRDQPEWRRKPLDEKILEDYRGWKLGRDVEHHNQSITKKRAKWFARLEC